MGDVKRWTVTYTKHIKQKRKVYQDGVLEFYSSLDKITLYDDGGKLLQTRFLKKDEVIGSGETLTFDAHLVDIGDPEGNHEPLVNFNNDQGRYKKPIGMTWMLHGQKARKPTFVENRKTNTGNSETPPNCPNMRLNIIREFQALYTTQITQKAKKYHDGIIQLTVCGSQQQQVMLYDASRRLLDSRFLKKDEVVRPGEKLVFDAYLVDIGDPEWSHKPPKGLNLKERDSKVDKWILHREKARHNSSSTDNGNTELKDGASTQSHLNTEQCIVREWHALYTTQITQKAKKYHDGILRLSKSSSHGKQAILLSEDGKVLSCKYLNSSTDVKTGSAFVLTNYVVEIGELRPLQEGELQTIVSSRKDEDYNSSRSGVGNRDLCGKVPRSAIRDAHQILSILKKPMAQEGVAPTRTPVGQAHSSQSPDVLQFCLQCQLPAETAQEANLSKRNTVDDHEGNSRNLNRERTSPMNTNKSEETFATDIYLMDPDSRGELQTEALSHGTAASNTLTPKSYSGLTDESTTISASSFMAPQVSNVVLDLNDDSGPPSSSMPQDSSSGNT
ncbi:PREDICTED: uncharacterized protein LOC104604753 isoform X2 [Nelumbo nucifera]|uniref:Uncharacterized protein LOC104604753 isoform X2 n=2 Tax=Nelumbo nucifera TaxID=4432 RepID=A0A1U8AWB5_NELNU|nr:PREDICTED: uncharacterized protein LOC104604753 isoform X2 [Nelumbo nucifera]DAD17947.1 TPA_asm: hypothetical protein HUJ06_019410 [Nelumbo nucifera]